MDSLIDELESKVEYNEDLVDQLFKTSNINRMFSIIKELGPPDDSGMYPFGKASLPKPGMEGIIDTCRQIERRKFYTKNVAWSVPSIESVDHILSFFDGSEIISVCAGTGLWEQLFRIRAHVKITVTDNNPPDRVFTPVLKMSSETAILSTPDADGLFICWPPYESDAASLALKSFNGDKVCYIGELHGCTADDDFHEELESSWDLVDRVIIPRWYGLKDAAYLYTRKQNNEEDD
jgi:hypothetical protein